MMEEKEKDVCLADSSGSDGSLSKDLSKRAEMNFSAPSLPLEIDGDEKVSEEVLGDATSMQKSQGAVPPEEKVLSPDYSSLDKMLDNEVDALMVCEKCQTPITKLKKYGNSSKQFCSRQCAQSEQSEQGIGDDDGIEADNTSGEDFTISTKDDVIDSAETFQAIESLIPEKFDGEAKKNDEGENVGKKFDWKDYQEELLQKAAPASCFGRLSKPVKGLKPGMKLEAIDKNNPCNYCVATVIEVVGHRVRIRYDGFGEDASQDFWCNFQAEELFQIGWCAENSYPLQPPTGISSTLEDWKIFLTKTLTGALASPLDLFRENENRIQTKVHSFHVGMKVEVIHPRRPSIICPATVTKSLGPFHYQVTTEPLPKMPSFTFYGKSESTGIFSIGWSAKHGIDLALPTYVDERNLTKDRYLAMCRMKSGPVIINEIKRAKNNFKIGQKVEAVDLEKPYMIRVATVFNVIGGRILLLLFDGHNKFQYMDSESEDIYPIGWCMKTGHPLGTPRGIIYPSKTEQQPETEVAVDDNGVRSVTLPSFHTVLGKQGPQVREELSKKLKARADVSSTATTQEFSAFSSANKEAAEKTQEDGEKHENYCVYFNKTCVIGPHLDPDKVAKIPDKTASVKPPAAVKLALEKIVEVAIDSVDTMDVIQEGFGAKLFSKGKSKVLKKGLFRFDTKVRASRLLKRLCKRLKSCEYFLSFDPPKEPCPFDCQNSGTTTLESFIAMKNSHGSIDEQSQQLLDRKKRGRPRKDPTNPFEFKVGSGKSEIEPVKQNNVKLLNLTSYNGRPLIPIAPGSKTPVTIMSSSQLPHTRLPPPYEIGSPASYIQPGNTVITSATQPRMVAPLNVRMIPPNAKTTVVSGADLSSPTLTAPNLATVLVMTKPQQGQGLFSIRGTVGGQGIRVPLSSNSRKNHLQLVGNTRPKFPGAIKIHGPMFDQAPGTMNPSGTSGEPKQNRNEVVPKYSKMGQLHIPSQKLSQTQIFDAETEIMNDSSMYRSPHVDKMSPSQISWYVTMKEPMDIKMEPQEQPYQGGEASQSQQLSPSVHIHLPSSNYRHSASTNKLQDKGIPADSIRSDSIRSDSMRMDSIRQDGIRADGITLLVSDHDAEKSGRSHPSSASPNANDLGMKFDLGPHQGIKRHQHLQTHIPSSLQNHLKNHLKVATTNTGDSQSALSPLHSPPPLRPAPSNQHRSIALRSPPNLTPSTVISHFDFSPVITTTSVISQTGRIIHHPGTPVSSKRFMEDNHNMGNGQIRSHEIGTVSPMDNNPTSNQLGSQPKTATMNFTYIPIKDQATDKIVYVPVNKEAEKDRQQPFFIYPKQHKQTQRYHEQILGGAPQIIGQNELKPKMAQLEDVRHQPFSGVTRKFTVRTLQRDSNAGSLPSGVTKVRIQGPNFKEVKPDSENLQEEMMFSAKDGFPESMSRSSPNVAMQNSDIVPIQRIAGSDLLNQRNIKSSNQHERFDHERGFYDHRNIPFEEISDDDDDDDDDEMDYEFSDENIENDTLNDDCGGADQRKNQSFGERKQAKKHFLSRRKSTGSHQYKLKYKQALEQAKFMREQRPSFLTSQRNNDDFLSVPRENTTGFDERRSLGGLTNKSDENSDAREEKWKQKLVGVNSSVDLLEKTLMKVNTEMQATSANRDLLVAKEHHTACNENGFSDKNGGEMKSLKRKRADPSSKFGNGFVFGQWALGEDNQIKKKKILNGTQSHATKYLSDPLEKVKLPQNPESWSEEDVANFLSATDCSQYAETLKDQEIDGSALLLLTRESLMEFAGMKLGPALKICGYVATLKGRLRIEQNMALIQG